MACPEVPPHPVPQLGGKQDGRSQWDRHRFDNHSAWLDREGRLKAKKEGRPLGFGFVDPKPPPPSVEERPFYVLEPAFCSGLMVHRKYNMVSAGLATCTERSDAHHFPNYLEVKDEDHYVDGTRRSQNLDPKVWRPDPKHADVISDDMVKQMLAGHLGETRKACDPKMMAFLFDDAAEPTTQSSSSRSPAKNGATSSEAWKWCLGGRELPPFERPMGPKEAAIVKSQSLPQMLGTNAPSMLHGNLGGSSTKTFHGLHTRKFGAGDALRMRGGKLAQHGWAGTYPKGDEHNL